MCGGSIDQKLVLLDRLVNGGAIGRHLVTQIPVNEETSGTKYHLLVKQVAISGAAYDFWHTLEAQISSGSSIQNPPPAIIVGNISNVQDAGDRALGFFGASAVATGFSLSGAKSWVLPPESSSCLMTAVCTSTVPQNNPRSGNRIPS